MKLLSLFLTFLKIGAVSFGGGYAMVPLVREEVLSHGWMTEARFLDLIAVSESTPGPIAVNMATFIGSSQGGIPGALCATAGVVLPSFIVLLLISAVLKNLMKYRGVQAALSGLRPAVAGLICITAVTMILSQLFGITVIGGGFAFEWRQAVIFLAVAASAWVWKKVKKKAVSPILLILLSALMGIVLYGPLG